MLRISFQNYTYEVNLDVKSMYFFSRILQPLLYVGSTGGRQTDERWFTSTGDASVPWKII